MFGRVTYESDLQPGRTRLSVFPISFLGLSRPHSVTLIYYLHFCFWRAGVLCGRCSYVSKKLQGVQEGEGSLKERCNL